jgi:epoxide hydrolase-like predicted phosphatase
MAIKAVIFDFAGVIGVDGYWAWLRDNITDLPSHEQYFHRISYQVDRAELTEEQFLNAITENCGIPAERVRSEILGRMKIDPLMPPLMRSLRPRYKVALLSNFVYSWLDRLLKDNQLYPLFDHTVISSAIAMAKPEPEIYQHALNLLKMEPSEAVFIDDRAVNVEAANRLGIHGLLFTSAPELESSLRALGVTPESAAA